MRREYNDATPVRRAPLAFASALLAVLLGTAAEAQFPQYTQPGSLALPIVSTRERVETGNKEAQWDLGAVRLDPRVWLRGPTFNDNVFSAPDDQEKVSDTTAEVGAGLVSYTNLGSDVLVSAYLLPSYTWWRDQDQLSESQLSFGAGVFGFYNRMTVIADARRDERQRFLNSELLVPFDVRSDRIRLGAEADLRGPFEIFGGIEVEELAHEGSAGDNLPLVSPETLDRDEAIARLGAAYRFSSGLRFGLGVEYSEAEFEIDPAGRSNTTLGPLFEVTYEGDELDAAVTLVLRDVDFEGREETNNELTGAGRIGWRASHRVGITLYGGRSLVYSARGADSFFAEERAGLSIGTPGTDRLQARVYFEAGSDDYERLGGLPSIREDDVTSFGGALDYRLRSSLAVSLAAARSDYESNLPGFDRQVTVFTLGARFGADTRPW